jgi:hypothetical protein
MFRIRWNTAWSGLQTICHQYGPDLPESPENRNHLRQIQVAPGKPRLKADTRASLPFPPRRKPMSRRLRFLLPFVLLAASMPPPAQAQSPVPDLEKEIRQRAAAIESKLIAWRRDIHEHPELGEQETRTSALVADHLTSLGLEVKTGVGKTGVVGLLKGDKPGPVVALRADMDALPVKEPPGLPFASKVKMKHLGRDVDVMHACGHDAHTAILMATAEVLTAMKDKLPGTVKFIFSRPRKGQASTLSEPPCWARTGAPS